jgi:hypothetical protein
MDPSFWRSTAVFSLQSNGLAHCWVASPWALGRQSAVAAIPKHFELHKHLPCCLYLVLSRWFWWLMHDLSPEWMGLLSSVPVSCVMERRTYSFSTSRRHCFGYLIAPNYLFACLVFFWAGCLPDLIAYRLDARVLMLLREWGSQQTARSYRW